MPSEIISQKATSYELRLHKVFFIAACLVAGLFFLASFGLIKRSWWALSVNAYLPRPMVIGQLAIIVICLSLFWAPKLNQGLGMHRRLRNTLFGVLFVAMCILLQESIPLYGDGFLFLKNIELYTPVRFFEVLSIFIYRAVYLILPSGVKSGANAYRIVNTLASLAAAIFYIIITEREERHLQPYFALLLMSMGVNVLFFGHIENYTLSYVSVIAYFILISGDNADPKILGFVLGIAVSLHVVNIVLVPSFIHFLLEEPDKRIYKGAVIKILFFTIVPMIATLVLGLVLVHPTHSLFKNLLSTSFEMKDYSKGTYLSSISNPKHFLDIIGMFFLVLPVWPVLVIIILLAPSLGAVRAGRDVRKLIMIAVPYLVFLVLFDSHLGLARDWDLGSSVAVWTTIAMMIIMMRSMRSLTNWRTIILPVSLLSMCLSIPWLVINRLPGASLNRYQELLGARTDLRGTAWGYEILAEYYKAKRDFPRAGINYELAARYKPSNWRHWFNAGVAYTESGNFERALDNLRVAHRLIRNDAGILSNLGYVFYNTGQGDSALVAYEGAYRIDSLSTFNRQNLGLVYYSQGSYEKSIVLFNRILAQEPNNYGVALALVDGLIAAENWSQARDVLDKLESTAGRDPHLLARRKKIENAESGGQDSGKKGVQSGKRTQTVDGK